MHPRTPTQRPAQSRPMCIHKTIYTHANSRPISEDTCPIFRLQIGLRNLTNPTLPDPLNPTHHPRPRRLPAFNFILKPFAVRTLGPKYGGGYQPYVLKKL